MWNFYFDHDCVFFLLKAQDHDRNRNPDSRNPDLFESEIQIIKQESNPIYIDVVLQLNPGFDIIQPPHSNSRKRKDVDCVYHKCTVLSKAHLQPLEGPQDASRSVLPF